MSNRDNEGDIVVNQSNILRANKLKTMALLLGVSEPVTINSSKDESSEELQELEADSVDPELVGIGGKSVHDIENNKSIPRSSAINDDLLRKLIGNKAAKAHLAAQKSTPSAPGILNRPKRTLNTPKREESEDEEEGRTAMLKSKKRKSNKPSTTSTEAVAQEIGLPVRSVTKGDSDDVEGANGGEGVDPDALPKKLKPRSFLDELLAEKSKKKKKKL